MILRRHACSVKTVLVFGEEQAILTDIVVECISSQSERVVCSGPVSLSESSLEHLENVILPLVDSLVESLGSEKFCYQVQIRNIGAASVFEQQTVISGHSMDVSLFIGLLGASLGLSVSNDSLFTGHIGVDGRILMIKSLPQKLACAVNSTEVRDFFIPSIDSESSLKLLRPKLRERLHCEIVQAKESLSIRQVNTVEELILSVFSENDVLLGALSTNRFYSEESNERALAHLSANLSQRFYKELRRIWMELDVSEWEKLIHAWLEYHIGAKLYPSKCGAQFCAEVQSLPPQIKRHLRENLSAIKSARMKLAQLAQESDSTDIEKLFALENLLGRSATLPPKEVEQATSTVLDTLLLELSERELSKRITAPLMEARVQFRLVSTKVSDSEEFYEIVHAFYVHLLQQTGDVVLDMQNPILKSESQKLLKMSYREENGLKVALREALEPTQGGISLVLDKMTQALGSQRQNSYVSYILNKAVDLLDSKEELQLAEVFLMRLRPDLPDDLQNLTAVELTQDWQGLILRYIQTRDQFHQLLRNT